MYITNSHSPSFQALYIKQGAVKKVLQSESMTKLLSKSAEDLNETRNLHLEIDEDLVPNIVSKDGIKMQFLNIRYNTCDNTKLVLSTLWNGEYKKGDVIESQLQFANKNVAETIYRIINNMKLDKSCINPNTEIVKIFDNRHLVNVKEILGNIKSKYCIPAGEEVNRLKQNLLAKVKNAIISD